MIDYTAVSTSEWMMRAESFYARLGAYMRTLSDAQWRRPTTYLGWSSLELAAHLTSAITINFRTLVALALDRTPVPPAGFDIFLRNAQAVDERRGRSAAQVMDEYDREIAAMLGVYRSLSESDWRSPAFFFIGDTDIRTLFLVQLSDIVVHERDLHVAQGEKFLFDEDTTGPLVDWFLRSFRPASFRPERAEGVSRTVQYRIVGSVPGSWHMVIRDRVLRAGQGVAPRPDLTITLTTEALVDLALARARPWVGRAARVLVSPLASNRREDLTAMITARGAELAAVAGGSVTFEGDRRTLGELRRVFWHFWERMAQTQDNIARTKLRGS